MFIPYFYTLLEESAIVKNQEEKSDEEIYLDRNGESTYTINKNDVVCFLPDLQCIERPKDFMWKFISKTTREEITPINRSEDKYPAIVQSIFGRYDYRRFVNPGYYDVVLRYKLDKDSDTQERTITSSFIVAKD